MNTARVIPLTSPDSLRARREEQMALAEVRFLYGDNAVLLSSEKAAECAAQAEVLHVQLSTELASWREAKDLTRELFG